LTPVKQPNASERIQTMINEDDQFQQLAVGTLADLYSIAELLNSYRFVVKSLLANHSDAAARLEQWAPGHMAYVHEDIE
jgi:hypothetical protein